MSDLSSMSKSLDSLVFLSFLPSTYFDVLGNLGSILSTELALLFTYLFLILSLRELSIFSISISTFFIFTSLVFSVSGFAADSNFGLFKVLGLSKSSNLSKL